MKTPDPFPTPSATSKVELRSIKYSAFSSEETHCFRAKVFVDGVPVGEAENQGHGGPTDFSSHKAEELLNAIAAFLPPLTDPSNPQLGEMKMDAELLVSMLVSDHLVERDLKRLLATRLIYTKADGAIYETKKLGKEQLAHYLANVDKFRAKWGIAALLNTLPFEEALALYKPKVR